MGKSEEKAGMRISRRRFMILILGLSCSLAVFTFTLEYLSSYEGKVKTNVVIEAGSQITLDLFTDDLENVKPAYDIYNIDTTLLGTYPIPFCCDNFRYVCNLTIVDTTPPTAGTRDLITDVTILPDSIDFVSFYSDVTPVTVSYSEVPDVSTGGVKDGSLSFKDVAGNETILPFQVTVIDDFDAPFIYGTKAIEVYENDIVKYRDGITVEDNLDPNPVLTIDTSGIDISTPGVYEVIYTATDYTGNSRSMSAKVTVLEKPEGYVEPDIVYELAQHVLDQITDESMTDMEKGFRIYSWCKNSINYIGTSDKSHWTKGAYDGFTTLQGDCYTYAACAKAMFDVIGVDNFIIERCDPTTSTHFWNLVQMDGQWYFADCSRTNTPMNAYLLTDSELDALNFVHGYRYHFDPTGLPNRATVSIQYRLNYYTLSVSED